MQFFIACPKGRSHEFSLRKPRLQVADNYGHVIERVIPPLLEFLVFDLLDRVFCFAITPGPLSWQRLSCPIGGSGGSGNLMALCRRQRRRSFSAADTTAIGPVRNRLSFRILVALDLADGDNAVMHGVACNISAGRFSRLSTALSLSCSAILASWIHGVAVNGKGFLGNFGTGVEQS